jgi:hypothetical protein
MMSRRAGGIRAHRTIIAGCAEALINIAPTIAAGLYSTLRFDLGNELEFAGSVHESCHTVAVVRVERLLAIGRWRRWRRRSHGSGAVDRSIVRAATDRSVANVAIGTGCAAVGRVFIHALRQAIAHT